MSQPPVLTRFGPSLAPGPPVDPNRAAADAYPGAKGADRRPGQLSRFRTKDGVAVFEAFSHLDLGEHAIEVDLDVIHPDLVGVAPDPPQQTGLSIAPRRRKTDCVAALGKREEAVRLVVAVDQVIRTDRLGEDERIESVHEFGITLPKRYSETEPLA
jgi:hypothetical protein